MQGPLVVAVQRLGAQDVLQDGLLVYLGVIAGLVVVALGDGVPM